MYIRSSTRTKLKIQVVKSLSFLLIFLLALACTTSWRRDNHPDDISDCSRYCERFYQLISMGDMEAAAAKADGDLHRAQLLASLKDSQEKNGHIIAIGETRTVTTSVLDRTGFIKREFSMRVTVTYQRGECKEEIILESMGRAPLAIVGYHFECSHATASL